MTTAVALALVVVAAILIVVLLWPLGRLPLPLTSTGKKVRYSRPPIRFPASRGLRQSARLRKNDHCVLQIDRLFFDVAHAQQVLMNGASFWSMEEALALGVIPQ
jgi:hypothetical protein